MRPRHSEYALSAPPYPPGQPAAASPVRYTPPHSAHALPSQSPRTYTGLSRHRHKTQKLKVKILLPRFHSTTPPMYRQRCKDNSHDAATSSALSPPLPRRQRSRNRNLPFLPEPPRPTASGLPHQGSRRQRQQ